MTTFIMGLFSLIRILLDVYSGAIVIYALMSWVPNARSTRFGQLLAWLVEPLLGAIERILPSIFGLSFAPILGILIITGLQWAFGRLGNMILMLL
ncbi:YggT family protein [Lapidilactobacillus achengensis]|uniref:YggT family protein n=1 Tax=Lapidilactobacillus achengensis TaxID=2486000 RepID=A0ABW1USS2_9LACO|nr:YggT family protein [Lapidilactobacillus achengensis]